MRRLLGRLGVVVVAVVVLVAAAAAVALWVSRAPEPTAFYDPPALDPGAAPGSLLRSEGAEGPWPEGARAWRILYVTPGIDGAPQAVSGLVLAGPGAAGPRPVLAWAHGTIGIVEGCAPSLLEDPRQLLVRPLDPLLARGWVVVATDYAGLGAPGVHPYLVPGPTGRAVLDSVRAARALPGLDLDGRVAVWGESQGGHAALATGGVAAAGYAPDLDLVGVGAAAPATDLGPLLRSAQGTLPGKLLTAQAVAAWSELYPELSFDEAVRPIARPAARAIAARCLFPDIAVVAAATAALPADMLAIDVTSDPRWSRRIAENTPSAPIAAPVLLAQGTRDQVVDPAVQRRWVARRCAEGQSIDLRILEGSGHVDVMTAAGPLLEEWTARLFAGDPVPRGCAAGPPG